MSRTLERVTRYVRLGPGVVELTSGPQADVPCGCARVEVTACGLCGTDLHLLEGMALPSGASYPVRPGHEVAGTVVELGPDCSGDITVDTPVVLHPLAPCGSCPECVDGRADSCSQARILGIHEPGGLASDVVWPVARMVPVPGVDPRHAAILADAVATAKRALDRARLPHGGSLCVLGAGGVGTHVLQLARLADPSARVVGVVQSESSARRLAAAGFQSVVGLDATELRTLGPFDAVVDFSGDENAPTAGMKLLRPGGTFVFGSVLDGELRLGAAARVQVRELAVTGVYSSSLDDLREVAQMARSGCLDLHASVTHEYSLDEAPEAFETLRRRPAGMVRVVVTVSRSEARGIFNL